MAFSEYQRLAWATPVATCGKDGSKGIPVINESDLPSGIVSGRCELDCSDPAIKYLGHRIAAVSGNE